MNSFQKANFKIKFYLACRLAMLQKIANPSVKAISIIMMIKLPTLIAQSHFYCEMIVPCLKFPPPPPPRTCYSTGSFNWFGKWD